MTDDARGLLGPIHCVSLPAQTSRRARLQRRAAHHDIDLRWVDAVQADAPLVDELLDGVGPEAITDQRRREVACLASHLLAIRTAVEVAPPGTHGVLIAEDDIVLHDRWAERLRLLDEVLSLDATLCCLGYLLDPPATLPAHAVGLADDADVAVVRLEHAVVMGTQLYWISLDHAIDVLASLDAPVRHLPSPATAELITTRSGGYFAVPPLAIEEALDTDIRDDADLAWHRDSQARWNLANYLAAEDDTTRAALLAGSESAP